VTPHELLLLKKRNIHGPVVASECGALLTRGRPA
jgi:hypothetical protein